MPLPPKVDLSDLQSNGLLLSNQQIETLTKFFSTFLIKWTVAQARENNLELAKIPLTEEEVNAAKNKEYTEYFSKKLLAEAGINLPFSIIVTGKIPNLTFYAVYKGAKKSKLLGAGNSAKVKLAQKLFPLTQEEIKQQTNWYALKVYLTSENHPFWQQDLHTEFNVWQEGGYPVLQMHEFLMMPYFSGTDLFDKVVTYNESLQKNKRYSVEETLEILNIFWSTISLLKKINFLHRDIKLENIIYDDKSGRLNFIDFSFAIPKSDKKYGAKVDSRCCGTVEYIAPEIIEKTLFSEQSEIFALARTWCKLISVLAETFATEETEDFFIRKEIEKAISENPARIFEIYTLAPISYFQKLFPALSENLVKQLHGLLQEMMDPDMNKRPSLEECFNRTQAIVNGFLELLKPKVKRTAEAMLPLSKSTSAFWSNKDSSAKVHSDTGKEEDCGMKRDNSSPKKMCLST